MHKIYYTTVASSNSSYSIVVCMPPDSLLLLLSRLEPEVALVPLERATAPPSIIPIRSDACILGQVTAPPSSATSVYGLIRSDLVRPCNRSHCACAHTTQSPLGLSTVASRTCGCVSVRVVASVVSVPWPDHTSPQWTEVTEWNCTGVRTACSHRTNDLDFRGQTPWGTRCRRSGVRAPLAARDQ